MMIMVVDANAEHFYQFALEEEEEARKSFRPLAGLNSRPGPASSQLAKLLLHASRSRSKSQPVAKLARQDNHIILQQLISRCQAADFR